MCLLSSKMYSALYDVEIEGNWDYSEIRLGFGKTIVAFVEDAGKDHVEQRINAVLVGCGELDEGRPDGLAAMISKSYKSKSTIVITKSTINEAVILISGEARTDLPELKKLLKICDSDVL